MGEAKERAEAMKKAVEEARKVLETPISQEEANKALAEIDIQLAQLGAIRLNKAAEITAIDQQIAKANMDKAIIVRRVLNTPAEETK